jgi:hypothetical protein
MDLTHSRVTLKKKPHQQPKGETESSTNSSTDSSSSTTATSLTPNPQLMNLRQSISKAVKATENHRHYFHRFHTDIENKHSSETEVVIAKEVEAQLKESLPEGTNCSFLFVSLLVFFCFFSPVCAELLGTHFVHHYYKCFEDNSDKSDYTHVMNVTDLRYDVMACRFLFICFYSELIRSFLTCFFHPEF